MSWFPASEFTGTRLSVHSTRLWYSIRGDFRPNCCFMHIPKCGGTSLTMAIKRVCPLYRRIADIDAIPSRLAAAVSAGDPPSTTLVHEDGPRCTELFAFRRALVVYFMARDTAFINGHFLFDRVAFSHFLGRYEFVSILRNPVERVVSNYTDARSADYVTSSFEEYLESDVAWRHANVTLRYFSGRADFPLEETHELIREAKENMRCFALIGFTNHLNDFARRFSSIFRRNLTVGHYRLARASKPELKKDARKRLEKLCAADLELYEFARACFT